MHEVTHNGESEYPPGIYEVPSIEPVPIVFEEYGQQVVQRIRDISQETGSIPSVIGALNGSVLPLYAVFQEWHKAGFDIEALADKLELVSTRKIGSAAECISLSESDLSSDAYAVVIEDIVDDGGTGAVIEHAFPHTRFELFAPLSKVGKLDKAKKRLFRTDVTTSRTVDDVWIIGGGGLDGGSLKLNGSSDFQNAELAVAARLMERYVYHNAHKPLPDYDTQLKTFSERRGPWVDPESTLHIWMLQAEWAKIKNRMPLMKDLAATFPYVLMREFDKQ